MVNGDEFSDIPFPKYKHAIQIKPFFIKPGLFFSKKLYFELTDLTIAINATLSFQIGLIGCHLANFDRISKQEISFELTENYLLITGFESFHSLELKTFL